MSFVNLKLTNDLGSLFGCDLSRLVACKSFSEICGLLSPTVEREVFAESDLLAYDDFLDFCKTLDSFSKVICLAKLGHLKVKLDSEEKLLANGMYLFSFKDFDFIYGSFINPNSSGNEMFSFVCTNDYNKFLEVKNGFSKFRNKDKVFVPGIGRIPIKDSNHSKDLFGVPEKEKINSFVENFLSNDSFKKNNIPDVEYLLFDGPMGSGKSTYVKSIIKDFNLYAVGLSNNLNSDLLVEAFRVAEENAPSIIVLEYMDEWLGQIVDYSLMFQLLNNLNPKNKVLVLATVDNKDNLGDEIKSGLKFKNHFSFKLPDQEAIKEFLSSRNLFNDKKIKTLSKKCFENEFEWEHLKLFVNGCIKTKGTGDLSDDSVNEVLNVVIKEKKIVDKKVNLDKYFV